MTRRFSTLLLLLPALLTAFACTAADADRSGADAAVRAPVAAGRLVLTSLRGAALEGAVSGDDAERAMAVYLPPDYDDAPSRRYPTLYLLHGIMDTQETWTRSWGDPEDPWGTIPRLMDHGIASGEIAAMIVVMPDMRTRAGGSFYVNSSVTGRWEDFTVEELVPFVDRTFRTLARPATRAIAGHSMGGYGALVLGMKHPDVWQAVFALSPALAGWGEDIGPENPAFETLLDRTGWDRLEGFYEPGIVCVAQAFSPNPRKPPFFADLPFRRAPGGGLEPDPEAYARWSEHFTIAAVERHRENLLRLGGLALDAGVDDQFPHIPAGVGRLSSRLIALGVPHDAMIYDGDHRNRLWGQDGRLLGVVLPWISERLGPPR